MRALVGLSAAALIAAMAVPAMAADLMVADHGMVAAPAPAGFEGMYIGAQLGGTWAGGDIYDDNYSNNEGWNPAETAGGYLLGAEIGYNFSVGNSLILGIEADGKAVFSEDTICSLDEGCGDYQDGDNPSVAYTLNGLGALNAKLGFNLSDNVMLYALAGAAVASVTTHHWDSDEYDGKNRLFTGWDVGIGAEMMVSDKMSIGVEGRYYDFSNSETWIDASDEEFGASPQVFTLALTGKVYM